MELLQQYIHKSRYARYLEDKQRRESWDETVERYCSYWTEKYSDFPKDIIKSAIIQCDVMPSMRALMTAGKALDRDNVAGYNCAYIQIDHPRCFDEAMYILMCGTGVGFSVERQFICKLPEVPEIFQKTNTVIHVHDSKIGWASAFKELLALLYQGQIPTWDVSAVRPAGARLKTFGGRASGPEPLVDLFQFTVSLFTKATGRKLTSIECHDLMCKVADIVVVGGVRRSALISLSNLTDERMRNAKTGSWWDSNVQRALANNSVAYTETPDIGIFMQEWHSLYDSKSGERGIFNRIAAKKKALETGRRDIDYDFGTNPCGEIILRSGEFCNLSEIIVREHDSLDSLLEKTRLATIIGTFQSTLTNFRYLRSFWRKNVEEERLLGVSLTGIMDHPVLSGKNGTNEMKLWLSKMKQVAIDTNKEWANRLGINSSVSITTVKPSGTVSQLVNSASGIHPRYSPFYIRTVRADKKDPISHFMISSGIPVEEDVTKPSNWVFSFPVASPKSVMRADLTAIEQLEHYLIVRDCWCEHNPSITVYVKEEEWLEVGAWVFKHFDKIGGISFLPFSDHVYRQAPYQEIDEQEYLKLIKTFPVELNWDSLIEADDFVDGYREYACVGGVCEIV